MAELTIYRGLRKLEFIPGSGEEDASGHARVEFARESPLPPDTCVHISLGMRAGKLRTLTGVAHLIEPRAPATSGREYLYRVFGQITEQA
jgi:hypothetical protein